MHAYHLLNCMDGLGFGAPPPPLRAPPGAPTASASGVPIVGWTSGSGWAARPIYAKPAPAPVPIQRAPPRVGTPFDAGGVPIPEGGYTSFYDEMRRFQYTREQMQEMIDRGKAAAQEITDAQGKEGGDGIAKNLEQQANEQNATDKAVNAAGGGTGLPVVGAPIVKDNLMPLLLAAVSAYLLLG